MGKFSDLPQFLLDNYFDESFSSSGTTNAVIKNSYLSGPRSSTVADGGYYTKLWIKVETVNGNEAPYPAYVEYKFRPIVRETYVAENHDEYDDEPWSYGNLDNIVRDEDKYVFDYGSLITLPASANGSFDDGAEVYFKKGSYVYEWLLKNSDAYKEYFNTNKMWMYFGKIWQTGEDNRYYIGFDGMKNFVMNAIPYHQRTENITEFMTIYFDKVYSKIYNMMKNIYSLLDAREVSTDWIEYIAKNYNMSFDKYLSGMALREWVENIVYLLKRRGTYSSLFIVWKTMLENTTNRLNVYDRWHEDLTEITDTPLGYFLDILHEMEYGVEPEGCAGSYWYEQYLALAGSVRHIQNTVTDTWYIYHQMYSKYIIVQCYDFNRNRIWPKRIIPIHSGLLKIEFETATDGYAYCVRRGDYLHFQDTSLSLWNIDHMLGANDGVISQYQKIDTSLNTTFNNEMIMPDVLNLQDANALNVYFSDNERGYGAIKSDGVYKFEQSTSNTIWTINHALGTDVLVQPFNSSDNMLWPDSLTLTGTDGGTVTLVFSTAQSGYILAKLSTHSTTLPTYDKTDMLLSTHYRVEVDLSCEPLDDEGETPYIISETTIDRLIENWELMRPVTRFSHYHLLLSPLTDFTGNYVDLYNRDYNAYVQTKYVVSAGELLPVYDADMMIHNQYSNKTEWTISHTLSATDWIVQCYNNANNRIWPKAIYPIGTNRVTLEFSVAVNGHAVFAEVTPPSGVTYTQSAAASAWDVAHEMNSKEVIIQWDDIAHTKMVPDEVILTANNDLDVTWSRNVKGYSLLSKYDLVYARSVANTEWIINHNLGTDSLIAQFFNDSDEMINPISFTLNSRNKATATFASATTGYVVLRGINKTLTEADVMNTMDNGIWVIGCGTSGTNYDPLNIGDVESQLASGVGIDIDHDDDYYYATFEVDNIINNGEDWNISEVLLLNYEYDPKFYSVFSPIHKPSDVWFNLHMRIRRSQT